MRTRLAPLAVLLAALVLAGDASGAAWGPPHSLSAHGGVYGLSVALGNRGRIGAAFVRDRNGNRRVELRRGTSKGLGRPVILDRSKHTIGDTALAFDRYNRSVAVWRRYVGGNPRGNHRVWMSSMDSHGAVLGPYQLTYEHESAYDPRFVHGADSQLLLHWNRRSFASFAPWEATARSSGPGLRVRLPEGAVFDVSLAVEADRSVVAVWTKNGRIMTATRPPGGNFGTPKPISSDDAGYRPEPRLVLSSDGHAVATWLESVSGTNAVMAASRPPRGVFGAPYTVAPAGENARAPQMAATTAGEVLVTYVATTAENAFGRVSGMLRIRRLAVDGRPLGAARGLSEPDERVTYSAIAASRTGHALVVWAGRKGSRTSVRSRMIAPDLIRGDIRTLSGSDRVVGGGYGPALAVGADGRAIVGWLTERYRARYALRARIA